MTKFIPWILGGLLVLAILFGAKTLYDKVQLSHMTDQLNEQLMQKNLELGKAQTSFGDAQKKIGLLEKDVQELIKKNQEVLTMYGELQLAYDVLVQTKPDVVVITDGEVIEVPGGLDVVPGYLYEALTTEKLAKITELSAKHSDFRLDASCTFTPYPNDKRDIPAKFEYHLHMRFKGQMVQTTSRYGAVNHYFNLQEIDDKGQSVGELELTEFSVVVQKPDDREFFLWNPKLDIGLFMGANSSFKFSSGASLGLTLMGYGVTYNELDWKFLRFGVDLSDNKLGASFAPAAFNLGGTLPLITNLWTAPYFSINTSGEKSIGLQLSVGL